MIVLITKGVDRELVILPRVLQRAFGWWEKAGFR